MTSGRSKNELSGYPGYIDVPRRHGRRAASENHTFARSSEARDKESDASLNEVAHDRQPLA